MRSIGRKLKMGLKPFSRQPIENLCSALLNHKIGFQQVRKKSKSNPDWIGEEYVSGDLPEKMLVDIVSESQRNSSIRSVLPQILECISENSITQNVFDLLISYPASRVKENILVELCHKKLPVNMLKTLCSFNCCFECYFELIIALYVDQSYSYTDFQNGIVMFLQSPFQDYLESLLDELKTYHASDDKKNNILSALCNA